MILTFLYSSLELSKTKFLRNSEIKLFVAHFQFDQLKAIQLVIDFTHLIST